MPESRPETPVAQPLGSSGSMCSSGGSSPHSLPKSRSSTISGLTSSDLSTISGDGGISVKIIHNMSIILLRIHRNISFTEMRAKIYDKFVQQEDIPLSASFAIALLAPAAVDYNKSLSGSGSMSSVKSPDLTQMRFISSQRDWEHTIASTGTRKLTLRAIGE
jgi:hypothetical protein